MANVDRALLPRRRFLIVHNPLAGKSRRHILVAEVAERLRAEGAIVTVDVAGTFEAGRDMAARAAERENVDAVVAAGGDSTIRGVASGLIGTPMPMGLIPVGTGNVLGAELGLVRDAGKLAHGLRHDVAVPIRTSVADGHPFLLMASAGFDARVLRHLDQPLKRRVGKLAYAGPMMRELRSQSAPFRATIDGREVECNWLIVTRAARYGGSFVLAPEQSLLDERFSAVVIKAQSRLGLAKIILAVTSGAGARSAGIEIIPCTQVEIAAAEGLETQLDGEVFQSSPLHISADGAILQLLAPQSYLQGKSALLRR